MSQPPTSSDLTKLVQQALNQPIERPNVLTRILDWLKRVPANFFRMDGYWGGITMWDPRRKRNQP